MSVVATSRKGSSTKALLARLGEALRELAEARATIATLQAQVREIAKENELLRADVDRYKKVLDDRAPHRPERVAPEVMQLAFEEVVKTLGSDLLPANDDAPTDAQDRDEESTALPPQQRRRRRRGRHRHGRRALNLEKLPVQTVVVVPDEVRAANGEGFERISSESSDRLAFRPGAFLRLHVIREKYKRLATGASALAETAQGVQASVQSATLEAAQDVAAPVPDVQILVAPVPDCLWPGCMADPSVIAHHIVSKYDDLLPLNRQQTISARHGFEVPRSTQAGWFRQTFALVQRVVSASFTESMDRAHCLAADATGVRIRVGDQRGCARWHVFVFIADHDHIVFRYSPTHDGPTIRAMVGAFKGYLLVDAAGIYNGLFEGGQVVEVGCWAHLRRYVWKSLASEPQRATAWLSILGELFEVQRDTLALPQAVRTVERARRAVPILNLMEAWLTRESPTIEPRTPLRAAVTYYQNQKLALHRFLQDGQLRLDNNHSEGSLRKLVLGQENWTRFENEAGVAWYCAFRSLIASCHLHALNPQVYLEQLLRLLPHWPVTRVLDLCPRYWRRTLSILTDAQRQIITPSWGNAATPDAAVLTRPLVALAG